MTSEDLDEVMRALAHRERRMFLTACLHERRPAGELAEQSSLSLATVSEHLKVLRKTGLMTLEKDGRFWYYRTDRVVLYAVIEALRALSEQSDPP
jgi:DNA-binding transcriptional ArsR family regulator